MIKQAIGTLLLATSTLGRVVVYDNVVEYNNNSLVFQSQYTDIYRQERKTTYGTVETIQIRDIVVHDWQDGEITYYTKVTTLYKINNTQQLQSIVLSQQGSYTNVVNQIKVFDLYIMQLTADGLYNYPVFGYLNEPVTTIFENKDQIEQDIEALCSQTSTTNAITLEYSYSNVGPNQTKTEQLRNTPTQPTITPEMYIVSYIESSVLLENTELYNETLAKQTGLIQLNVQTSATIENEDVEVIDLPGLLFSILIMPFSFISTAFNLTIFPGTPYQINISNLVLTVIASLLLIFIIKKFTK